MRNKILLFSALLLIITSCGSKKEEKDSPPSQKEEQTAKKEANDNLEKHPGKALYVQYCGACHQTDGSGVPGMYPPLQNTEYVNGDIEWLVNNLVNGLEGPIEVKGEKYNNLMPALDYLTDEEMAKILSYVRLKFGDDVSAISTEEVAKIREKLKEQ